MNSGIRWKRGVYNGYYWFWDLRSAYRLNTDDIAEVYDSYVGISSHDRINRDSQGVTMQFCL